VTPRAPLRWSSLLVAALLAALLASPASAAPGPAPAPPAAAGELVLSVLPQAPPLAMDRRWSPFLERLSARAGVAIRLRLYEEWEPFVRDFERGAPDLLYAHPSLTAAAHRAQGYLPLVRDRQEIAGVLFVRKDAPFASVADLRGRRIAFVGQRSFCTIIAKDLLTAEEAAGAFQEQNAGSTRNVLKAVALGKADAGASLDYAAAGESPELVAALRPLATSRALAAHPLSAHPRVPPATRERLVRAVLEMAASPDERALLAAVRLADPVRADYRRDYLELERLLPPP